MRLLLLSDTHGDLDSINPIAAREGADAVIHAGDFGFYDDTSHERLTGRELWLRVAHSHLDQKAKKKAKKMRGDELREFITQEFPLSDLPHYLRGERTFDVPLYAVHGNHEDREVLLDLQSGARSVPNLHMLDHAHVYRYGRMLICGLGGNVLLDGRLFEPGPGGKGGKVWASLTEVGQLIETVHAMRQRGDVVILVTHVSPGKQPLVTRLGAELHASFCVSGHMGSPYTCVWSEFAIREPDGARAWLESMATRITELREEADLEGLDDKQLHYVQRAMYVLRNPPSREPPAYYRGTFFINLPDVHDGHALLEDDGERVGLVTRSRGRLFR